MNFEIKACYDVEGLAQDLGKWFTELVPQITVSQEVWEGMATRVTNYLNEHLLEMDIVREGHTSIAAGLFQDIPNHLKQILDTNMTTVTPAGVTANTATPPRNPNENMISEKMKSVNTEKSENETTPTESTKLDDYINGRIVYDNEGHPDATLVILDGKTKEMRYFNTVRGALNAYNDPNDTIILLKDLKCSTMITLAKKIRLNLNGHVIVSEAPDYAIWTKSPAIITNGMIRCTHANVKAGIYVSSTLVVAGLEIHGKTGVMLNKGSEGPAMLETHGLTVYGQIAVDMIQDGNILNDHGYGLSSWNYLVHSNGDQHPEYDHKVLIHKVEGEDIPNDYDKSRFSDQIQVTFL